MSNQLEQSKQRRLHRLRFLPANDHLEQHATFMMPTDDSDGESTGVSPSQTPIVDAGEQQPSAPLRGKAPKQRHTKPAPVLLRLPRYQALLDSLPVMPVTPMDSLVEERGLLTSPLPPISLEEMEAMRPSSSLHDQSPPVATNGHTHDNGHGPSATLIEAVRADSSTSIAEPELAVPQAAPPLPPLPLPSVTLPEVDDQKDGSPGTMKSELNKAAGNAGFVGAGQLASFFFRYGNNFLIQRGLGAGSYGVYSFSISIISLISSIFMLGLDNAMLRYTAIYNSRKQGSLVRGLAIFCTLVTGVAGLIGALLVLAYVSRFATLIHRTAMIPIVQLFVPLIPLLTMQSIWMNGLQGFKEFKKRVLVVRIYVPTISFILLLITLIFFRNLYSFALATLAVTAFSTIFVLYYLAKRVANTGNVGPKHQEYKVREWVGYALPNILTSIVEIVNASADTLLLGYFAISYVAIGQYAASIKVTTLIGVPLGTLTAIFAPTIAELYSQGEVKRLDSMFKIMTKWTITFSLPIFCVSCIFAADLLGLSGPSFIPAWPLLIAFAIGALINTATGSVGTMLLMTGHQKVSFLNSLAAIITNFVLGFILTPRYGVMGVAISTGLALAVLNIARLLQVVIFLKMQPYTWHMLKPLAAAAISSAIIGGLLYLLARSGFYFKIGHFDISLDLSLVPVYFAIYAYLLYLFKLSPEDQIILDKLNKKFKLNKLRKKLRLAS